MGVLAGIVFQNRRWGDIVPVICIISLVGYFLAVL
jgi:hypothetical protein